jgi:hypothetical protein
MQQLSHNLAQKRPLLRQDELVFFRKIEVGRAFSVVTQPRAIRLIRGEALEGDQGEGDVVRAFIYALLDRGRYVRAQKNNPAWWGRRG